ncbi:hypothetical protein DEALK_00790 [Dehalogenimonas alkenigignens]|uniref:Uncharacterized protein n=1 Tax=Dehalogenimonas alkenigignens TaxID=1217799 RepID=A0A0W0GKS9_9CHLR|nr:hypothetical protein [Dehalogenimonas alkenigignens]KTB49167.1 hypothetical protein DEALK_00790 [Dehalogenimonas alkenigignens]
MEILYLVGFLAVLALIIGIIFRYTAAAERRGLPPGLLRQVSPIAIGLLLISLAHAADIFIFAILGGLSVALGVFLGVRFFWDNGGI